MASVLYNLRVIPVDGMVCHPGVLCYSLLVGLASNASFFVLLEPSFEASLGLTDVDFTTSTRYFVNNVYMRILHAR